MTTRPLLFNPMQASSEELDATFVARDGLRDRLLESLRSDSQTRTKRHWLVLGERGAGKSHLVEVVSRRLARDKWLVARLPEELFRVGTLGELFEAIAVAWGADPAALRTVRDEERLVLTALEEITRIRKTTGRHGLVVLENLDALIDRKLNVRAQHRLREVLMNDPPFLLLATSTVRFHGMAKESAPFYDFFQTAQLGELNADEVFALIEARARWQVDDELLDDLGRVRERVAVIQHFSGGNPRLALALYTVLRTGELDDLRDVVQRLLDEMTPYYQSRVAELSAQEQRVLAAVALSERPPTQAALARECRLGVSQTTAVIQRLEAAHIVRRTERLGGARNVETADRFLRIWFQMRENPDARTQLRWLTEFFRAWYRDPEEVREAARAIGRTFWGRLRDGDEACVNALRTLPHLQEALRPNAPLAAEWLAREALAEELPEDIIDRLEPLVAKCQGEERDALIYAFCRAAMFEDKPKRALQILKDRLDESPTPHWMWNEYRRLLRASRGSRRATIELLKLAERSDVGPSFLANVGIDAIGLGQVPEGESLLSRATPLVIACEHCVSRIAARWISVAARCKNSESIERAMTFAEAKLEPSTLALLAVHRDIKVGVEVHAERIAEEALRFSRSRAPQVQTWIEALFHRAVAKSTVRTMLDVFTGLGAPLHEWIGLTIMIAEVDARWIDEAMDHVRDASVPPALVARLFNLFGPISVRAGRASANALHMSYAAMRARELCDVIPPMEALSQVLTSGEATATALARLDAPMREAIEKLVTATGDRAAGRSLTPAAETPA